MGETYETLWGQGYITDYIGDVRYQISPLSFLSGESGTDRETLRAGIGICTVVRT